MSIVLGPKLGLLFNCNIDEYYADNFRPLLQALDQLIMGSVINASTTVPPSSPNPGDAYLLPSSPTGAWIGHGGNIAVWDTQVTNTGTNVQVPAWVFYVPNAGWILWNVATSSLLVYNGSTWLTLGTATTPTTYAAIPTGTINGSNTTFTISPAVGYPLSLQLFANGFFQQPTTDYSISSGITITMVVAPPTGTRLYAIWQS